MNMYGHRAAELWAQVAPSSLAEISDREKFFTEMGERIGEQVDLIRRQLETQIPAGKSYLERVGQMQAIRLQAEEVVFAEVLGGLTPEPASLVEELEEILGQLPEPTDLVEARERYLDRLEQEAEEMGWQVLLSEEDRRYLARIESLLQLLAERRLPEDMTEPELRQRIEALRPHIVEG